MLLKVIVLRAGDTSLMEAMLAAGAEPNQKDLRGETALQVGSLSKTKCWMLNVEFRWKV